MATRVSSECMDEAPAPNRSIGTLGLTFVAIGGVVGSGLLFAPLFAAQQAGPAAILAWPIAGLMFITIALVYAEISAMLPVVGGLGLLPTFSHGQGVGIAIGWVAWVGYVTAAPIETQAMLEYASNERAFDWLFVAETSASGQSALSLPGLVAAAVVLIGFTALNAFGVALFTRVNSGLTWVKLIIPVIISVALLTHFSTAPIQETGFAPEGLAGVLSAITTGGVAFAFLGFRHALDLAGEVKRPQLTIPVALVGGILVCTVLFTVLQLAFIGATDPADLNLGWAGLDRGGVNGPLAALLSGLGMAMLAKLVVADAILGPFGAGLVSTASTGRLTVAVAENGLFPRTLSVFSRRGVPMRAMVLNLAVGMVLLLAFRDGWSELLSFNSGAIVLSMCLGPVTLMALRRQVPDRPRPFRLQAASVLARVAFVVISLIIYWTGWETMIKLTIPIAVGVVVLAWRIVRDPQLGRSLSLRSLVWLGPYYVGLLVLTFVGWFGGGRELLPFGVAMVAVCAFALVMFEWGVRSALPAPAAAAAVAAVPEV